MSVLAREPRSRMAESIPDPGSDRDWPADSSNSRQARERPKIRHDQALRPSEIARYRIVTSRIGTLAGTAGRLGLRLRECPPIHISHHDRGDGARCARLVVSRVRSRRATIADSGKHGVHRGKRVGAELRRGDDQSAAGLSRWARILPVEREVMLVVITQVGSGLESGILGAGRAPGPGDAPGAGQSGVPAAYVPPRDRQRLLTTPAPAA